MADTILGILVSFGFLDAEYTLASIDKMKLKSERATDPRFISERMIGRLQECFLPLDVSFAA